VDQEEEQTRLEADLVYEPRKRKGVVKYLDELNDDAEKKKTQPTRPKATLADSPGSAASGELFTEKEVRGVHRGLMKFGTRPERLDQVIQEAGTKKGEFVLLCFVFPFAWLFFVC
jgi:hypothetical protein